MRIRVMVEDGSESTSIPLSPFFFLYNLYPLIFLPISLERLVHSLELLSVALDTSLHLCCNISHHNTLVNIALFK